MYFYWPIRLNGGVINKDYRDPIIKNLGTALKTNIVESCVVNRDIFGFHECLNSANAGQTVVAVGTKSALLIPGAGQFNSVCAPKSNAVDCRIVRRGPVGLNAQLES
jgi:hypothetical protein